MWQPPLRVPNARQFKSTEEGIRATIDYIIGVFNSDPANDAKGYKSIYDGAKSLQKSIGLLVVTAAVPDPVPIVDEVAVFISFLKGSIKIVSGIYEIFDIKE